MKVQAFISGASSISLLLNQPYNKHFLIVVFLQQTTVQKSNQSHEGQSFVATPIWNSSVKQMKKRLPSQPVQKEPPKSQLIVNHRASPIFLNRGEWIGSSKQKVKRIVEVYTYNPYMPSPSPWISCSSPTGYLIIWSQGRRQQHHPSIASWIFLVHILRGGYFDKPHFRRFRSV